MCDLHADEKTSSLNTIVGAVAGALPPVIGWTAAGRPYDTGAAVLFGILFFWQLPHFIAINWMYREEYEKAGFVMWSNNDESGRVSAWLCVVFSVALLAVLRLAVGRGAVGMGARAGQRGDGRVSGVPVGEIPGGSRPAGGAEGVFLYAGFPAGGAGFTFGVLARVKGRVTAKSQCASIFPECVNCPFWSVPQASCLWGRSHAGGDAHGTLGG